MFILNEEKVNDNSDNHLKSCDIRIYSNEHGVGHLELKTTNKSYYVFIPSVIDWKLIKTITPLITSTKKHSIPSELSKELILWFKELSKIDNFESYTNIEYCRHFWNVKNLENPVKNLIFFKPIKDVKLDVNGNEIKEPLFMIVGGIKFEIIEDSKNRLKFKYQNNTYVLTNSKIFPESKFLQSIFDKHYTN